MWLYITIVALLSASAKPLLTLNRTSLISNRIVKLPVTQTCFNIINFEISSNHEQKVDTILKIWHPKSVTIFNKNSTKFIQKNHCQLFVIFYEYTDEILHQINFQPFTRILIITKNFVNLSTLQNFYFKKSINIMTVMDSDADYDLTEFLDDHQFINRLLRNEDGIINLRASFFHCPPFVIISKRSDDKVYYDGIEMRCLHEIARNWNLTYVDTTPYTALPWNLWETTLNDINTNVSDLAMCSIWQNDGHGELYDLSSYINIQCVTLLVPKPSAITQALIIVLPFKRNVWILFVSMMLLTAILIRLSIRYQSAIATTRIDRKYNEFGSIIFEIINISTAHGLYRFPFRLVLKFLFFGWILTMLLVDTAYSTVYTSIMTIPQYSKSIDTIKDFVASGLRWSEPGETISEFQNDVRKSGNPDFLEISNGLIHEENLQHRMNLLAKKKVGKMVKVLSNKFVIELENVGDYASTMRPLKECLFNYYTVFAFRKNSPFKKIFDRQISRVKAAGLLQTWFDQLMFLHFNETLMGQVLERHGTGHKHAPKTLQLEHLVGGFYLLLIGLIISTSVFCTELIWKTILLKIQVNDREKERLSVFN